MDLKDEISSIYKKQGKVLTSDVVNVLGFSRQYVNRILSGLVDEGFLVKINKTRNSFYVLKSDYDSNPVILAKYKKTLINKNLEEHKVLDEIEKSFPLLIKLHDNIKSVFDYAFSEMFNNAIEHSSSEKINIEISLIDDNLVFTVKDFGIGVFRNIMNKKGLNSEYEAIQDLLKGKTTTMPKSHSGEGIFFTSKVCDSFILNSFGFELLVDNKIKDVFIRKTEGNEVGTRVVFRINKNSHIHLLKVFEKYTDKGNTDGYGFDKTEVKIKLYTMGGVHISRSQARRVLTDLEKFSVIVFDFDKVPVVGQAFADEIFRVFHNKYPNIRLDAINMDEGVKFMIERSKKEAEKGLL